MPPELTLRQLFDSLAERLPIGSTLTLSNFLPVDILRATFCVAAFIEKRAGNRAAGPGGGAGGDGAGLSVGANGRESDLHRGKPLRFDPHSMAPIPAPAKGPLCHLGNWFFPVTFRHKARIRTHGLLHYREQTEEGRGSPVDEKGRNLPCNKIIIQIITIIMSSDCNYN